MRTKPVLYFDRADLGAEARFADTRQNIPLVPIRPEDIVSPGWYCDDSGDRIRMVAAGDVYGLEEIAGILNLVSVYLPSDFPGFKKGEAEYLAGEVNAFLASCLMADGLNTLNRPGPSSLSGPSYPKERWLLLAEKNRSHVMYSSDETNPSLPDSDSSGRHVCTVIGDEVFGAEDTFMNDFCLAMAQEVECRYLRLMFMKKDGKAFFVNADSNLADEAWILEKILSFVEKAWLRYQ